MAEEFTPEQRVMFELAMNQVVMMGPDQAFKVVIGLATELLLLCSEDELYLMKGAEAFMRDLKGSLQNILAARKEEKE